MQRSDESDPMLVRKSSYQSLQDQSLNGDGVLSRAPRLLWIRGAMTEIAILAPIIVVLTISVSTIFYRCYDGWEFSTSLYFACQTIVGIMYGVPEEDRKSQGYTLFLYFLGSTYIYAAIAAYANLIAERTVASAKDIALMEHVEDLDNRGVILPRDWVVYACNKFCNALDWNHNKFKLITVGATVAWIGVGVAFGLLFEEYDFYTSVYFSLDAMMLSGTLEPPCDEIEGEPGCSLGTVRALFMSVYLLVGSTLFLLTMGQFYESLVSTAQLEHQRQKYQTQFTQEEFDYAATTLRSGGSPAGSPSLSSPRNVNRSVDLAQFILLELLRTEAINHDEIQYLRTVFESLNKKVTSEAVSTVEYHEIESEIQNVV